MRRWDTSFDSPLPVCVDYDDAHRSSNPGEALGKSSQICLAHLDFHSDFLRLSFHANCFGVSPGTTSSQSGELWSSEFDQFDLISYFRIPHTSMSSAGLRQICEANTPIFLFSVQAISEEGWQVWVLGVNLLGMYDCLECMKHKVQDVQDLPPIIAMFARPNFKKT